MNSSTYSIGETLVYLYSIREVEAVNVALYLRLESIASKVFGAINNPHLI
ncbi:MAG: hypothetical protein ICV85_11605 [Tolypothrix sp. T3-bin4]|nr:hypothetical protein [Tolypothrix sp. T3-bin4]